MYEFHGWIKLAESASEVDEGGLEEKCGKLRELLSQIDWPSGRADLLLLNGFYTLVLNAIPNRKRSESEDMENLISFILSEYKGAFGIIYEYEDDVNLPCGRGMFSVSVIKRGECKKMLDPFLSPLVPTVEDE